MKEKKIKTSSCNPYFSGSESRILLILLAVIYGMFTFSAFIKISNFWGINYLYYLPSWVKILFISFGALVFIHQFNSLIYAFFQKLSYFINKLHKKTERLPLRILYLLCLSLCFGGLFYFFRVVSPYHDPMGAIYFMERNIPISEYYKHGILILD